MILNRSVWPIDRTQTGTTTPGQSGSGNNGNEGVLHILQTPEQEPHYQMQFNVLLRTHFGWGGSYASAEDTVSIF